MAAIPLVILTGFLGSGKSTLLARLIRAPQFADTAVIVNEFGEVGIDHALLARGDEDNVVLLDSGCICCSLTTSLEDTLEALYYRRERGEIPPFARVVVETTGLADPGPIATALSGGMFVARRFRLGAIVVTVDAVHGAAQIAAHDEARRQVAMADRIVLTKVDIASGQARDAARAAITALNPFAPVTPACFGETDYARLLDGVADWGAPAAPAAQDSGDRSQGVRGVDDAVGDSVSVGDAVRDGVGDSHGVGDGRRPGDGHGRDHVHDHDHDHGDHLHAHGYVAVAVRAEQPLDWDRYARWVASLQRELGERLLRVKGFVRFDDGVIRVVQGVQLLFTAPAEVATPIAPSLVGSVVLIAQHVDAQRLRALCEPLTACAG